MDILKLIDFPEDFYGVQALALTNVKALGMKMEKAHLYKIWLQL